MKHPDYNSEGKLIHPTAEGRKAFWRWFGDSKVVDGQGRPLVVYHHGTFDEENRSPFNTEEGVHFGSESAAEHRAGTWEADQFIENAEVFEEDGRWHWYSADGVDSRDLEEDGFASRTSAVQNLESTATSMNFGDEPYGTMTRAYLKMLHPRNTSDRGANWEPAISSAKQDGHDGLIYHNKYEGGVSFCVFSPTQIKSINNRGTFDPSDPVITNPPEDHSIYTHEGKFWGKAGAGILLIASATGRILVGKRSRYVNEPGTWNVFGGAIDPGEDPAQAAAREVQEELGYDQPIAVKLAYVYESGTFRYYNFVGLIPDEFTPRLNWETEEARWVTPEELRALHNKHYGLKALLENYP